MTEVVAALIEKDGTFLICRRPAHKARALLWEFAGGKVEKGETRREALRRECREELGVEIAAGDLFFEVEHLYPDLTIRLSLYRARIEKGEPQPLEHAELRWITPEEIGNFEFCPADEQILEKLRDRFLPPQIGEIREKLFALKDPKYRDFTLPLIPTVVSERVIGIRFPALRALAKELSEAQKAAFLSCLPHYYFEEDNLHAILLSKERDAQKCEEGLRRFLPLIDSWSTSDTFDPKAFVKDEARFLAFCREMLNAPGIYEKRFAVISLMKNFLDERFDPEYPALVAAVRSEEYYVNMACAWYFAEALAKQYSAVLGYFENGSLTTDVRNKAIRKAIESRRIPEERKRYLRTLKR